MADPITKEELREAFEFLDSIPLKESHIIGYIIVNEECPMCGNKLEGEEGRYSCSTCDCSYIRAQEGSDGHMLIPE
jgi:Zn finger protein HypA/HybF involved in hydrogenase expression